MIQNFFFMCTVLLGVVVLSVPGHAAVKKWNIVTTQTYIAELARAVGQDQVDVTAIASPKYNIHFIEPKPSDVRKVRQADLYITAGLGLEAWSDPLLQAAGNPALFQNGPRHVDVSKGIRLRDVPSEKLTRAGGDIHSHGNPHYHMDPRNAGIMAKTIAESLKRLDPDHAKRYQANLDAFTRQLNDKINEWNSRSVSIKGREVFSYHEDIVYFADFLGISVKHYLEPKPGIPPTAKHLQFLAEYAREQNIQAIIMPSYYPKTAAESLAQQLSGRIITVAQGVGEVKGTEDLFRFFDFNVEQVIRRLTND